MRARLVVFFAIVAAGLLVACGGGAKQVQPTPPPEPRVVVEPKPAVPDEPEPPPAPKLVLAPIYFDYDRSDIRTDQRGPLADNAKLLESNPEVARVVIEGHCDERGTNEYNMALGQRRADSVKKYLTNYGIAKTKLSTLSLGEERPVDPGHTEAAWSKNRRAEFLVQK